MCINCLNLSRRAMLAGAGALAASTVTGTATAARILPANMVPLIGAGYRPTDKDEVGIWQQMERVEEEVAGSNLLVQDPQTIAYLRGLFARVGGPAAKDMRIYLARIPEFNAVMFPTGFAVVFSGLLLRMRNEAQLAGVIAHEAGHFLRKHQIRQWRDMRRKTDLLAIASMAGGVAGGVAGFYTGNLAQLAQFGTILSLLKYSRELEAEADAMGLKLISDAGLRPTAMSETWDQLIAELDASALYRRKRHHDRGITLFANHPLPETRRADLKISAAEVTMPDKVYDDGHQRYVQAISKIRPMLLDDQVKLNDPGASQYVVETLAMDGWNGLLRFYEGEIWRLRNREGDDVRAAQGYAAAVQYADAPADAWRWHGIMLQKTGRTADAKSAYQRYLSMAPNAPDAPFIRQQLQQ
jgi:predicted Zn-dependent protease